MRILPRELKISAPGRVCLFGEHQDYLGLPVIAAAISLRIAVEGRRRLDSDVRLSLPDIRSADEFSLRGELVYTKERDYFRSAVNVLRRHGFTFSNGFDCEVRGAIPVNAGTSSSSALLVAWVNFLARMSDQGRVLPANICARYAYEAEVLEFGEPGGMMDQYTSAIGGVVAIDFAPEFAVAPLPSGLGTFVLGDSAEPKNTRRILAQVKNQMLDIVARLAEEDPHFSLIEATVESVQQYRRRLTPGQFTLLEGTVINHAITEEARELLGSPSPDAGRIGDLLNKHQSVLRDVQKISTPKIDGMLDAALRSGAYGGKINGSGGGGCMFAYAPDQPARVAEAVERAGGTAYVITVDEGTRVEVPEKV